MKDIKERLARIRREQGKAAPSLHTGPREPREAKPKEDEEDAPHVLELGLDKADAGSLIRLAAQHRQYADEESKAKAKKDAISDKLKAICAAYAITKVSADGIRVSYYPTTRHTLDPKLLLLAGVKGQVLNNCTISTTSWSVRTSEEKG